MPPSRHVTRQRVRRRMAKGESGDACAEGKYKGEKYAYAKGRRRRLEREGGTCVENGHREDKGRMRG